MRHIRFTVTLSLTLVAVLCLSPLVQAQQNQIAFSDPLTNGDQASADSLGLRFDVTQSVTITDFGVFDANAVNGSTHLLSPLYVQMFNRNTQQAVSPVIGFNTSASYTLVNSDRFQALNSPLVLPGGFQGEIVAWGFTNVQEDGNRYFGNLPPTQLSDLGGRISFPDDASDFGNPASFPTEVFSAATYPGLPAGSYRTGFLAGTFGINVTGVPETSTIVIAMLGLAIPFVMSLKCRYCGAAIV